MSTIIPHSNAWYDRLSKMQDGYYFPWHSTLGDGDGETLALGLTDAEGLTEGDTEADGLTLGLTLALGDTEAEGLPLTPSLASTSVVVMPCGPASTSVTDKLVLRVVENWPDWR